ncbi:transposable element Tcb2 transposase [Trichonephila clavipes]|nr:transposable element Tcb2 transposase [Trichonephila clavipes]
MPRTILELASFNYHATPTRGRLNWPLLTTTPLQQEDKLGEVLVAGRQPPPQTLQELERALLEEWDRIPQLVINSLIDSMPQRCSTLLAVRGNHTPY